MAEAERPPKDVQPLVWSVAAQRQRMHEFFQRRLQEAKQEGSDCAWVYRNEITAEGEAMGLNEAQSVAMARDELERNWFVPVYKPGGRRFVGAVFTDFHGLCTRYGYP